MPQEYRLPPIFVAGSGRSGTTWVGETIASCSGCIAVFEPLHPNSVAETPRWGVHCGFPGPYMRAGGFYPVWEAFFDALLAGKISNSWTRRDWTRVPKPLTRWWLTERIGYRLARIRHRQQAMRANRYVIKEIRANLMLDWLASYTGARIVYLIRHPCAVIGSQLRQKEQAWVAELDEIFCQPPLMSDFLEPFRRTMSGATTPLERQAVRWCVENFVPFSQAGSKDWLLCCYEEFISDRDGTFGRVFRSLGVEPTSVTEKAKKLVVSNPTHDLNTTRPWHAPLSEAEGEVVLRICEDFSLRLYGRQRMPLCTPRELVDSAFVGHSPRGGSTGNAISSGLTEVAKPYS
ncbi:MAG: sulfotransferase [Candidatus Methylomirabilales bacterium]